ncbi:MAG TPA: GNAT family N-acetyltransferase [Caulobacteraceae bacterium]|jgi:GNAT superfamily N-acetyltransferase
MPVRIRPLAAADHADWLLLWQGYLTFYAADIPGDITALTWSRLLDPAEPMHAAVAVDADNAPIGFVHWLTHRSTWARNSYAYLEDLFVAPAIRGGGVGQALTEHVYAAAEVEGCAQVYWLTHETNETAMKLYDRVATKTGFRHYAKVL